MIHVSLLPKQAQWHRLDQAYAISTLYESEPHLWGLGSRCESVQQQGLGQIFEIGFETCFFLFEARIGE